MTLLITKGEVHGPILKSTIQATGKTKQKEKYKENFSNGENNFQRTTNMKLKQARAFSLQQALLTTKKFIQQASHVNIPYLILQLSFSRISNICVP